jgi:hypothetical protein
MVFFHYIFLLQGLTVIDKTHEIICELSFVADGPIRVPWPGRNPDSEWAFWRQPICATRRASAAVRQLFPAALLRDYFFPRCHV